MAIKQTVVLKVTVSSDKDRTKAMKIAAAASRVTFVQFEKDQENLMLEGEDVDIAALAQTLSKKVGKTAIFKVNPV